ncbi:unnamed protein product [Cunninghamella blakesleeana]
MNKTELDLLMEESKTLMAKEKELLKELNDLEQQLKAQGVGMTEPLIDNEGYPLSDIDIPTIRLLRNRIHHVRNDHKDIMKKIESTISLIHSLSREAIKKSSSSTIVADTLNNKNNNSNQSTPIVLAPFAKVNAVAPDSPAYIAGLQRNDQILKFGNITAANHQQLQALTSVVSTNIGQPVEIKIIRDQNEMILSLTPRTDWGGRGALGCHIIPI